ncbi:MAG: ATP-binding protein [Gammaproteobacteria bacterium]
METDLLEKYQNALGEYLARGGEASLNEAYELGRTALSSGKGLLEVVSMHQLATVAALNGRADGVGDLVGGAGRFLIESLSPYEVLQLGNRESNAALRRLNQILEEEAKRIAHVLHDEAAQMLATVYLELSDMMREAPESVHDHVRRITAHLDTVREQLRRLSHELRPPILDQLGLLPALQFLGDGYRKRTELEVTVSGSVNGRFNPELETAFYRAVQEALNNVVRHARATKVGVRLWVRKGTMHCTIKDDGVGFDPAETEGKLHGLGLLGIRERVAALHGSLAMKSAPGKGTELHISIPLATDW